MNVASRDVALSTEARISKLTLSSSLAGAHIDTRRTSSPEGDYKLRILREVKNFFVSRKPDLNELQIRIRDTFTYSNVVEVTTGLSMRGSGKKVWNPLDFLSFQLT